LEELILGGEGEYELGKKEENEEYSISCDSTSG
jgi:hypothetical protein